MMLDNNYLPMTVTWNGNRDGGDSSSELGRWQIGKIVTDKNYAVNITVDMAIRAIEVSPGIGVRNPSNPFPPNSDFWSDPKEYSRDNAKPYLWLLALTDYNAIFSRFKQKHEERGGFKFQNADFLGMNTFNVMDRSAGWLGRALFDLGTLFNVLVQLTPLPKYEHDKPWYKRITLKRNTPGSGLERDWLNIVVDMTARKHQGTETFLNKTAWYLAKKFGNLKQIFHEYYKPESGNNYEIAENWFSYFERN